MKPAVLIIDVQSILFEPSPQPYESEQVVERINKVAGWARTTGVPVIYIQHEKDDSVIAYGSEGWQLQSDLIVKESDLFVRKTTPDSFLKTNLESILKSQGVNHLYICGYATEFCVDTTTRKAAALGYSVDLISDAHTTHDKQHLSGEQIRIHHNATLPGITSFGVNIATISTSELTSL